MVAIQQRQVHAPSYATCALAMLISVVGIVRCAPGDDLLYNQVQFIGTDQSYHQAPPQGIINSLKQAPYQAAFANQSLNIPEDYYFSHLTFTQMLNSGIRGFEINVLEDPLPGKYAHSAGLKLAGQNSLIHPDLLKPGIKVLTSPDFDFGSSCYLFTSCLREIAAYSAGNPGHFPITIFIHHGGSPKSKDLLGGAYNQALAQLQAMKGLPMNFTDGVTATVPNLEKEILTVFNRNQLYAPDDLRADNHASSDAALRDIVFPGGASNGSWPTIGRLRNKIVFIADPDYLAEIAALHPKSTNSLMWFSDDQGNMDPNTVVLDAFVDVRLANTSASKPYPIADNADAVVTAGAYGTQSAVLQGFFVRGGADTSSAEAMHDYTLERDSMATIGGPQFLATLYENKAPSDLITSNYAANPATVPGFAGAEAICNPVTTAGNPTMGSTAFAADGAINQLGAATIIQNPPACSIPQGFSAGKYLKQPGGPPSPVAPPSITGGHGGRPTRNKKH